ncbi:MAG: PLP-dependent aminotransferase family protein [Gemmatimonadota bacterium]
MPKARATLPLMLPPRAPGTTAHGWLAAALRAEILAGRLSRGTRLPSTRDLATQYRLARGTVVGVIAGLKTEGYVHGRVGSGTYVSVVLPDDLLYTGARAGRPPIKAPSRRVSAFARRVHLFPSAESRPMRAFRANVPDVALFPKRLWARIAGRRLRRAGARELLDCDPLGYRPLRQAIADYLTHSRGVHCMADQIAVVSGSQEALDLVARVLLNPGDRVCMENPGYVGASLIFRAAGARTTMLRVDEQGMVVPGARAVRCRLAYVTPAHQFPLGTTMTLQRRLQLLEWARASGALILEDDYDSEYRYAGRPVPALQGLDRSGRVLFTGSFGKVLFPGLRLGYLVTPPDLVSFFESTKSLTSRHAQLPDQVVLCDFITEGHFGRHVRRMREIYAQRLAVLVESARAELAGLLEISGVEAGLQTVGWLREGHDGEAAARAAAARGVEVTPISRFYRGGRMPRDGLQIGFAAVDQPEIRRGVRDLARALEESGGR